MCHFLKWLGDFLYHVSPQIVAVVFGGLLINRFFIRKANLSSAIDRACTLLEVVRENSARYWSEDYNKLNSEQPILEVKLKGTLIQLGAELDFISTKYGLPAESWETDLTNLYDVCTGGNFESAKRIAEKDRHFRAVKLANLISQKLQHNKI